MESEIKTFVDAIGAVDLSIKKLNYFQFPNTKTLVAVKISRSAKPFWGINKRIIDFANEKADKSYLVLLTSEKSGWVYSKDEMNSNIKNNFWKCRADDNNYKINYGSLSDRNLFSSHRQFLEKVNERDGKGDIITKQ